MSETGDRGPKNPGNAGPPSADGNTPPVSAESGGSRRNAKPLSGMEFTTIGLEFGAVLVGAALAGVWLDKRFGTSPILLILGTFAGAGGGIYSMYRRLMGRRERDER
jgi:F0F1-type ATP synthase assembly protein I